MQGAALASESHRRSHPTAYRAYFHRTRTANNGSTNRNILMPVRPMPPPLQHRPAQVRVRALRAPSDDHTLLRPITASLRGATHHSQRGPASGSDCRPSFVPDLKRSAVDVLGPKGSRSQPDRPGETARRCGRSSRSVGSWRNTAQTKDSALVSPFGHASAIVPSSLVKSPSQCRRHRQEQRPSLIAGYAHCWAAQAVPPYAAAALLGFETGA